MYVGSTCSSRTDSAAEESNTTASTATTDTTRSTRSSYSNTSFIFPPAPRICKSATSGSRSASCRSDSSLSDNFLVKARKRSRRRKSRSLPPIGVFWDIENCQVPKSRSAASVVQRVRECFFDGYRETDFVVVCDVKKENPQIIQELHDAQVNLIHVSSTCKNAADEKLRQSLRRFGETYKPPGTVVLISGDINFSADLADLRYRKKINVILVHNTNVSDALIQYANESYLFPELTDNLPLLKTKTKETVDLLISNLPTTFEKKPLKNRLKLLSDNCGGRVVDVNKEHGTAIIRFATEDFAVRAQRRLNGEDVFGRKIIACGIDQSNSVSKLPGGRKLTKAADTNGPQPSSSLQSQGSSRGDWRSPMNRTPDLQANSMCDHPSRSFQPIPPSNPVDLVITNLDASMRDLRTTLGNLLKQYAMVYNISINYQEAKPTAIVKVANQQDAEYVISKMHHQKLGFRRISISYARNKCTDLDELKERVVYLLQESAMKSMPLYMLLNKLEERYLMKVSLCEINKLREVCQIIEEKGERLISLTAEIRASPPANLHKPQQMHYCCVHCPNGMNDIGAWLTDLYELPCVNMSLSEFASKLNKMLSSHMGTLPLLSFTICYKHEFDEWLPMDNTNGVPLEHLVTCINNVKLKYEGVKNKAKYIIWETALKPEEHEQFKNASPLATSISLLRREFIDLLKSSPKCQIPLSKYVPAYHHHFGRQLRVADYGYTKLDDLLHSPHLSNVVQILGEGSNRILTLTHSTQKRRFTSDLLRVLKSQVAKQIALGEFPEAYVRVFNKQFSAVEYGVCTINDLLEEVPENMLLLTKADGKTDGTIGIPQRVRTPDEVLRTRQFADEVVKLLSHAPNCSMLFEKFVPHYHHHFGHQCKVSDYGFTKLIELFEAIPETVKVEELPNGQRKISLTAVQGLHLLGLRIRELIHHTHMSYLPLEQLYSSYSREFKSQLNPQLYNCSDITEVIGKLTDFVTLSYSTAGPLLIPVERDIQSSVSLRVWSLLVKPPYHSDVKQLISSYFTTFQTTINISHLEQLDNIILSRTSHTDYMVFLIPEYVRAAKLYNLLYIKGGNVPFGSLESLYMAMYSESLMGTEELPYDKFFADFSYLVILSRSRRKTSVALNPKLVELGLAIPTDHDDGATSSSCSSWPAPPSRSIVPYESSSSSSSRMPPKPDTPPPQSSASWMGWQQRTPRKYPHDMEFSITLPQPETPKFMGNPNSLISPAKNLLPAHPMGSMISSFTPPEPNELPTPDKLLKKGICSDDSADSGVNNSQFVSESEMDISQEPNLGAKPKSRNSRLNSYFNN